MTLPPPPPPALSPRHAAFADTVRASFAQQGLMGLLGARLAAVEPGRVVIELPFDARLSQQHGFAHAGAITSVVDSACGYAALSLLPPGFEVLTIEFKINFLNPARGDRFTAVGEVVKAGRQISVCQGRVTADIAGQQRDVALMQATMMAVPGAQA